MRTRLGSLGWKASRSRRKEKFWCPRDGWKFMGAKLRTISRKKICRPYLRVNASQRCASTSKQNKPSRRRATMKGRFSTRWKTPGNKENSKNKAKEQKKK